MDVDDRLLTLANLISVFQMVRTFHNSIGDQNLLQKKIVRNPRYANVESRLDTGASLSRHQRRVDDIQENFKIRPNEIFKRVKLSALAELILLETVGSGARTWVT